MHIYGANLRDTVLGGLIISTGVTNANFYSMVDILFTFENTLFYGMRIIRKLNEMAQHFSLGRTTLFLRVSYFLIHGHMAKFCVEAFTVNNEPWLARTISLQSGTRVQDFCDSVRSRD